MNFQVAIAFAGLSVFSVLSVVHSHNAIDAKSQNVIVTDNIEAFMKAHPDLKIEPMNRIYNRGRSLSSVKYSMGSRISGDKLVAQSSDSYEYPAPKDVTIQLTYPTDGKGSIVNYVEIVCNQGNTAGNAYVVEGGIGQRIISIVVEANQTNQFSYLAQFYGSG